MPLQIKNLCVSIENKKIIENFSLKIQHGELHVLMGKNGSGKSTLVNAIMGKPGLKITKGSITLNDQKINDLPPNARAKLGLFMSFQNPVEIPGVSMRNFLRTAKNEIEKSKNPKFSAISPFEFIEIAQKELSRLKLDEEFLMRPVNEGFSGGEKKKAEILQMAILKPAYALLDEIDSGLDIDALKQVATSIRKIQKTSHPGILLITHYNRILKHLPPDFVHIFHKGKIIKSGDKNLAREIEENGYEKYINTLR